MNTGQFNDLLTEAKVSPTPNRILVVRELANSASPMSLGELETSICTMERSSILRVLATLAKHHLIHTLEDGKGIVKYELCHSGNSRVDSDLHVHFYCESCKRVYCFDDIPVPPIDMPAGFTARSVNYMLKGICPDCAGKTNS